MLTDRCLWVNKVVMLAEPLTKRKSAKDLNDRLRRLLEKNQLDFTQTKEMKRDSDHATRTLATENSSEEVHEEQYAQRVREEETIYEDDPFAQWKIKISANG